MSHDQMSEGQEEEEDVVLSSGKCGDISVQLKACENCGGHNYVVNSCYDIVCADCGLVLPGHHFLVAQLEWDNDLGVPILPGRTDSRGRYRPVFHWHERIAQLCTNVPEMDPHVLEGIVARSRNGQYPAPQDLRPHHIVSILRELNLIKYRERWKWLLMMLNPEYEPLVLVDQDSMAMLAHYHELVEHVYLARKIDLMPRSLIRRNGSSTWNIRHNALPFNYLFRKLMEASNVRALHAELPLLRSPAKLHILDDITGEIFKHLGLKFSRTPVIRWPKIRKSKKKKKKKSAPPKPHRVPIPDPIPAQNSKPDQSESESERAKREFMELFG